MLESEWMTINSDDEKMRSFSVNTNREGVEPHLHPSSRQIEENPFVVDEEVKEENSRFEQTPGKKKGSGLSDEEESDNS